MEILENGPGRFWPASPAGAATAPNLVHAALRRRAASPYASFAPPDFPTNMAGRPSQKATHCMAIEKCINEFDVDEVIFEEGSTGRELFVVLEGNVEIAKIKGAGKTVIDGSSRSATAIAAAPHTRVMRINHARFVYLVSQQPAFALMIMDALSKRLSASNAVTFRAANPCATASRARFRLS